jgi:Mg2+-importing ATPase
MPEDARLGAWWASPAAEVLKSLGSAPGGLTAADAAERLVRYGANELAEHGARSRARVLWNQLKSPLVLLLVFAAGASLLTRDWIDAGIVVAIVLASVSVGYAREYRAETAAAELRARVRSRADVLRDGHKMSLPLREVVPGDVVLLAAGSVVPADGALLEATDFFVDEAVLTGESFPTEKRCGAVAAGAGLAERSGAVFLGTNVRSGAARCVVADTGMATQLGAIGRSLATKAPEAEFDRGIRRFGWLLTISMSILIVLVFAANVLLGRAPVETLLFAIALAVGLSPELLPAILSVNLARGAKTMAGHGVLVRRLPAIENLGSMDVLCTDKTGTLTQGVVKLDGAFDPAGAPSAEVRELGALNAALQAGLANPLDQAILEAHRPDLAKVERLGEVPYDFVRKRLSVVVRSGGVVRLVTKGAFEHVIEACTRAADGTPLDATLHAVLTKRFADWAAAGTRVIAVATRTLDHGAPYGQADESALAFAGFLTFLDAPKQSAAKAIADLGKLGVAVKLITGDAKLVAQHVATAVGLRAERILSGKELAALDATAFAAAVASADLFAEVDPAQKEQLILALKKNGHVVGYLGDGVNDAPAMHAADTSLSVDHAVDVAREAADFVLLERDLDVIRRGIEEGRRTFANTMKYILTTTSANLGNMLSMAVASLFLPFLPLLAGQILLNNFLSDVPALGLAGDSVDPELVARPHRWDLRFIGRFMLEFGVLSSLFDFLTFGALLYVFAAGPALFRTGWFVESLLTELAIALVVRTRRPFFKSRPGTLLLWSTVGVAALALGIPFIPHADILGFTPLPLQVTGALVGITLLYVLGTELLKARFYRRAEN